MSEGEDAAVVAAEGAKGPPQWRTVLAKVLGWAGEGSLARHKEDLHALWLPLQDYGTLAVEAWLNAFDVVLVLLFLFFCSMACVGVAGVLLWCPCSCRGESAKLRLLLKPG